MTHGISERFRQILSYRKLIYPGDKIFVACSGGPDSVALFFLLKELQSAWRLRLGLIHFHHGLRGREADRDERFVRGLARELAVPYYAGRAKVLKRAKRNHESVEEAARKSRYDYFVKTAGRRHIPKIAFAHTKDDQAETVLMRIVQGTGLKGLSAIQRRLYAKRVAFIRPLLDFSKAELLDYLKKKRITFCRDRSNHSLRFLRNRIRKQLLPWLMRRFNPKVVDALARLPDIVQDDNDFLSCVEAQECRRLIHRCRGKIYLVRDRFRRLAPSMQFRVLCRAIQTLDPLSGLNYESWQNLKLNLDRKTFRHSLPRDIDINISPSRMTIYKKIAKSH